MTTTEYLPDVTALSELEADLDVLSDSRRRFVIALARSHGATKTVRDLVHGIATREHDGDITEVPREEQMSIGISLYHHHLPMMADAGVVDYREERGMVALTDVGEELADAAGLRSVSRVY